MRASERWIALLVAAVVGGGSAFAQDQAAREREALQRMQRTVSKLQQENVALAREKGELAARLETATKEFAGLKDDGARERARATAAQKELVPLREERDALKQKLEVSEKQLAQTVAQRNDARKATEKREAELASLSARLKQETGALQACTASHDKLQALVRELTQRYEKEAHGHADPVFGLGLVEIENQLQGYRDRADELRLPAAFRR